MLFFKIGFFIILSVTIPFFIGFVAHALKSFITRKEEEGQTAIPVPVSTPPEPESAS